MDISEAVTEFHKMKRGNYAVSNSSYSILSDAVHVTEYGAIARTYIREEVVGNNRQAGPCEVHIRTADNRHERGSLCAEHCVQREPIQRGLTQQIKWSTWSMAITVGQTRMVITQTNRRSTQVCATSI